MTTTTDPFAVMRTRSYRGVLVLAVVLGAPIAFVAYWFLKLTDLVQHWAFTDLPKAVGFDSEPTWWPVLPLLAAGLVVGLTIRHLPGHGGESPIDGFKPGRRVTSVALPGVFVAAVASIGLGAVVGPEAPLIALGGGLACLAVAAAKRDVPDQSLAVIAATGSFAAISTLLGTPLAAAFLLMEASGLGGPLAIAVLLPGLLAAGVGALIFTGLDSLTGYGTFSLAIPNLPAVGTPTLAEFGYALAIGLAAAALCLAIRRLATAIRDRVEPRLLLATIVLGVVMAGLAIAYAEITDHGTADVLFSGQAALPQLVSNSASYTAGALTLLVVCKGLAYTAALSGFRGGPTFPAMFIGAAGGMALSHLPGLSLAAGLAMGLGAMTAGMLRLPMTAVLLTTLFLGSDAFAVMPLTIVAVVVAYVTLNSLAPAPAAVPAQRATEGERPAGSAESASPAPRAN